MMETEFHGFSVSCETRARLDTYSALLRKWNSSINLVSRSSVRDLETRHVADSLQLAEFATDAANWLDIGTGAGLPGLVIAASDPRLKVTLVESDQRKVAFLREASRQMKLDVSIRCSRIESAPEPVFDIVSARALAPLSQLFTYALPWLRPEGRCIFMKGVRLHTELDEARKHWRFSYEQWPSKTSPEGAILVVRNLRHA